MNNLMNAASLLNASLNLMFHCYQGMPAFSSGCFWSRVKNHYLERGRYC